MADVVSGDSGGSTASAAPATASPAVTPGTSTTTPAAATEQPTGDGSTATDAESQGPIPYDRHKAILTKRDERLAKLAWAENVSPDRYRQMSEWFEMADRNPIEFHKRYTEGLKNHPTWGQYFQPQTPAAPNPEPEPDLVAENGQPVYSAPQLRKWQEWNNAKTKAELQSLVSPLLQKEQQSQAQAKAREFASHWINELSDLEGFDELRPEIAKRLKEDGRISPLTAYKRAYAEVYKPAHAQAQRTQLVAEMNQTAQATTANPNSAGATPKSFKEMPWEEVLSHFAKK